LTRQALVRKIRLDISMIGQFKWSNIYWYTYASIYEFDILSQISYWRYL